MLNYVRSGVKFNAKYVGSGAEYAKFNAKLC